MIPAHHLAWVAGVLDLKGTIVAKNNKTRRTKQLVLMVESRHMEVIRGLSTLTGTAPEMQSGEEMKDFTRRGCVEHCPTDHVHVSTVVWPTIARWTVTGAAAATVLHNVLPYMRSDRGLSEVMKEIIANTPTHGQGWGAVSRSLLRLKELGWELPDRFDAALEANPTLAAVGPRRVS